MFQPHYNVLVLCCMPSFCHSKGLEKSCERHEKVAEYFHAGLESMGLKLFVKEKVSINTQSWNLIMTCSGIHISTSSCYNNRS